MTIVPVRRITTAIRIPSGSRFFVPDWKFLIDRRNSPHIASYDRHNPVSRSQNRLQRLKDLSCISVRMSIMAVKQNNQKLSERGGENARPKLGTGLRGAGHHVSRQVDPQLECVSKCKSAGIMQEEYGCKPDGRKRVSGKRAYRNGWRPFGTP